MLKWDKWDKFQNILDKLNYCNEHSVTLRENRAFAIKYLEKCIKDEQCTEENDVVLEFVNQQFLLVRMKKLKYTTDRTFWSPPLFPKLL